MGRLTKMEIEESSHQDSAYEKQASYSLSSLAFNETEEVEGNRYSTELTYATDSESQYVPSPVDAANDIIEQSIEGEDMVDKLHDREYLSFQHNRQISKIFRRYTPKSPLSDVFGLLSTGLLEGLRVAYKKDEVMIFGIIKDLHYLCGCSLCNYQRVVSALKFESHARAKSKNQNNHIYLESGISLYNLVKKLKNVLLERLGDVVEEMIGCTPNFERFEVWKDSFQEDGVNSKNGRNSKKIQLLACTEPSSPRSFQGSVAEGITDPTLTLAPEIISEASAIDELGHPALSAVGKPSLSPPASRGCTGPTSTPSTTCTSLSNTTVTEGTSSLASTSTPEISFEVPVTECIADPALGSVAKPSLSPAASGGCTGSASTPSTTYMSLSNTTVTEGTSNLATISAPEILFELPVTKCITDPALNDVAKPSPSPAASGGCTGPASTPSTTYMSLSNTTVTEGTSNLASISASEILFEVSGTECIADPALSAVAEPSLSPPASTHMSLLKSPTEDNSSLASTSAPETTFQVSVTQCTTNPAFHGVVQPSLSPPASGGSTDPISTPTTTSTFLPNTVTENMLESENVTSCFPESGANAVRQRTITQTGSKKRDNFLHKLIFLENGLADGIELTYRVKGKILLTGYKHGMTIMCACHKIMFSPSQFEAHAGMKQRRQPYRHIYTSDGRTLHDISLDLFNSQKLSENGKECTCLICGSGRELIKCDGCSRSFHSACLQLHYGFDGKSYCHFCARAARSSSASRIKVISTATSSNPCSRRLIQTQAGEIVHCTICKDGTTTLGELGATTIIFCNQCDKAYHIGCLKDPKSFNLEEVFGGQWLCCTDCVSISSSLRDIINGGSRVISTPFLNMLKRNHIRRGLSNDAETDVYWELLSGRDATRRKMLLHKAITFFIGAFEPIDKDQQDLILAMVLGKELDGGLDFRGTCCAVIREKSFIVSAAILRVFGGAVAEIPLAATHKLWQGKGYFRILLSLIEKLLSELQVRLLVAPVDDGTETMWINKFGFAKTTDHQLQLLKEEHPLMMFERTTILEKAIPAPFTTAIS